MSYLQAERPWVWTGAVALLFATAAAAALLPMQVSFFVFAGLIVAAIGICSVVRPLFMIHFIVIGSAVGSLLRVAETSLGGVGMTISGLRWAGVAGLVLVVLLARIDEVRIPWSYLPLLAFCGWIVIRLVTAEEAGSGLKDVLFYTLPPVVGLYGLLVLPAVGRRQLLGVERVVIWSAVIPALLYAVTIPLGLVEMSPNGPKGIVGPRPLSAYLLVALCVCLANWRYPRSPRERLLAQVMALIAVATVIFTGSRFSTLLAVSLLVAFRLDPSRIRAYLPRAVAALLLVAVVFLAVKPLRQRVFLNTPTSLEELPNQINTSGRRGFWTSTIESAVQKPIIGWGPGSSRRVVAGQLKWKRKEIPKEYPPHNEYLQVWHDGGLIALTLLVVGWVALWTESWRRWRRAHARGPGRLARWSLAAVCTMAIALLSALVDNTLHYAHVMAPLFLFLAIADTLERSGDRPAAS